MYIILAPPDDGWCFGVYMGYDVSDLGCCMSVGVGTYIILYYILCKHTQSTSLLTDLYGARPRANDGNALALQALRVVPLRGVEGGAREILDACVRVDGLIY